MNVGKISIIMPVFNQEKYIEEAINSVLEQTYKNYELIIVNDGSTDGTQKIINKYSNHKKIKIIQYKSNKGKVCAVNSGFKNSEGDYIALLAGDDVLPKKSLEMRVTNLDSNYQIAFGNMYKCDEKLNIVEPMFNYKFREIVWDKDCEKLIKGNMVSGGSLIITRSLAKKIFPIPIELRYEDWWISFTALYFAKKIKYINDYVLYYRIHSSNDNGNFYKLRKNSVVKKMYERQLIYYKKFKEFYEINNLKNINLLTIINTKIEIYSLILRNKIIPIKYLQFTGITDYLRLNLISKKLDFIPRLIKNAFLKIHYKLKTKSILKTDNS